MSKLVIPILMIAVALMLTACEYKRRETFPITTSDGRQIRLTCPVVESARSKFSYLIDRECVVEPTK